MTDRPAIRLLGDFRVSVGPRIIDEREWTLRKAKSLQLTDVRPKVQPRHRAT